MNIKFELLSTKTISHPASTSLARQSEKQTSAWFTRNHIISALSIAILLGTAAYLYSRGYFSTAIAPQDSVTPLPALNFSADWLAKDCNLITKPSSTFPGISSFAACVREKGNALLNYWNHTQQTTPCNAKLDLAYRAQWMNRQQCPSLSHYIDHQINHGYFNNLCPNALKDLYGNTSDLSNGVTRNLYHRITETIPAVAKKLPAHNCLDRALAVSQIRSNARLYTRLRMVDQAEAQGLNLRDIKKYGMVPDTSYLLGKYGSTNMTKTCEKLIAGAQTTNWFYNLWATLLNYIS